MLFACQESLGKKMDWTSTLKKNPATVNLIEKDLNVSKVIAQLLVNRDINDFNTAKGFFRPSFNDLHDPYLMKDMHESVLRIEKAKEKEEKRRTGEDTQKGFARRYQI